MNWILFSIFASLLNPIRLIFIKKGLLNITTNSYTSYESIIVLILFTFLNIIKKIPLSFSFNSVFAGIFQGIASIFLNYALNNSNNPGLPMATYRSQAVLTALLSVYFFGVSLPFYKLVAMILVVIGIYLLSEFQEKDNKLDNNKNNKNKKWIVLSLLAGGIMSIKDIFTRKSLKNDNLYSFLFACLFSQTVLLFIYQYYITGNIRYKLKNKLDNQDNIENIENIENKKNKKDNLKNIKNLKYVLIPGIFLTIYIYLLTNASKLTPNIGYVKSIDNLGIVVSILVSSIYFKTSVDKNSWFAIFLTVIGITLVCL